MPTGADTIKATIFSLFNNLLLVQQSSPCCLTIFSLFNNLLLVQQLSQIFSSNVFSQQLFWRSYKIVQFSIVVDNQHFLFSRNSFIIDFQSEKKQVSLISHRVYHSIVEKTTTVFLFWLAHNICSGVSPTPRVRPHPTRLVGSKLGLTTSWTCENMIRFPIFHK